MGGQSTVVTKVLWLPLMLSSCPHSNLLPRLKEPGYEVAPTYKWLSI